MAGAVPSAAQAECKRKGSRAQAQPQHSAGARQAEKKRRRAPCKRSASATTTTTTATTTTTTAPPSPSPPLPPTTRDEHSREQRPPATSTPDDSRHENSQRPPATSTAPAVNACNEQLRRPPAPRRVAAAQSRRHAPVQWRRRRHEVFAQSRLAARSWIAAQSRNNVFYCRVHLHLHP